MKEYLILLYYHYTDIEDPESFRYQHHLNCIELNLRGRIIIAREGINGTVSGLKKDCESYMSLLRQDERFGGIEFKIESHFGHAFEKLNVRVKSEIVHSGLIGINPRKRAGTYIEPEKFRKIKDEEDVVIVDVRSNYEHNIGKFKNAITFDIENFRDFPDKVREIEHLKDKRIITYCTGGIKCEKASAYLLEQGFKNVYQLHGGIIKYGAETGGEDFEGKCYVFDNRVANEVNSVNPTVISTCHICGTPCDRMVNCANPDCNKHVPICASCAEKMQGACSPECMNHPQKRPFEPTGYYAKKTNGYNPYRGMTKPSSAEKPNTA